MTKEHYICRGCKTVLDVVGICETEECRKFREPLEMCDCPNGWHKGAFDDEDAWEPVESR